MPDKCVYPDSSDTQRTFDRLQADQTTTLIPKICNNEDGCVNRVCGRDPAVLTDTVGCIWCDNKNTATCDPPPSNLINDDDYYECYSTTAESCGM